jgi:hypothetical protein
MTEVILIPPVEGFDLKAGSRDVEVELHRDEFADPMIVDKMLDRTGCETFDLVHAREIAAFNGELMRLRVGDVLTMRVVINT